MDETRKRLMGSLRHDPDLVSAVVVDGERYKTFRSPNDSDEQVKLVARLLRDVSDDIPGVSVKDVGFDAIAIALAMGESEFTVDFDGGDRDD